MNGYLGVAIRFLSLHRKAQLLWMDVQYMCCEVPPSILSDTAPDPPTASIRDCRYRDPLPPSPAMHESDPEEPQRPLAHPTDLTISMPVEPGAPTPRTTTQGSPQLLASPPTR